MCMYRILPARLQRPLCEWRLEREAGAGFAEFAVWRKRPLGILWRHDARTRSIEPTLFEGRCSSRRCRTKPREPVLPLPHLC